MIEINALGKPCPIPVIEVKKAIRSLGATGGEVRILVDNVVARQNIEKMAKGSGYATSFKETSEGIEVTITVAAGVNTKEVASDKQLVIAFGQDRMGSGQEELGKILVKSFIYSLTELDTPPEHLLFFNSGAYLTNQASNVLPDLKVLSEKGTLISTCGTCLDYYGIKEELGIGEITNMYGISEVMAQAQKVINI